MAQTRICCLCLTFSNAFKSLFNINGQFNDIYEITVQYFDPMLFNSGKEHISRVVICLECWRHISDFHNYQQYVMRAQSQLNHERPIIRVVKLDEMIASQDNQAPYNPVSVFDIIQINDKTLFKSNISQEFSQVAVPSSIKSEAFSDIPSDFSSQQNCVFDRRIKLKNDAFISKWKADLKCIICKEIFASYNLLTLHFHRAHPDEKFHVICCKHKFYNSWQLIAHLRKHNKWERGYIRNKHTVHNLPKCICNYCKKSFKTRSSLKIHKKKVHYNIKLEKTANNMMKDSKEIQSSYMQDNISLCSIASDDIDEIYEMISKESPEKEESNVSFQNEVPCSSTSANHDIQRANLDIVDKQDEIFICSDSDSNVDQSEISVSHINKTNEYSNSKEPNSENEHDILEYDEFIAEWKEYLECPNCEEMFTNYFLLCEHFQNAHPSDKCHIICCESKFDTRSKIVTHLRQFHARINRNIHKCETCGASFAQYGSLRRHIRKKHAIQSLLEWFCNYCKSSFKTRSSLERHKKRLHSNVKSNNIDEQSSEEEQTAHIPDNIRCISRASNANEDIHEVLFEEKEDEEQAVNVSNEISYSSVAINDNIQKPALDIVDVKDEIITSSDNESLSNSSEANDMHESNSDKEHKILEYDVFIAKWKGDLKCPKCKKICASYSSLEKHFNIEHPSEGGCYIICCKIVLNDRSHIVEHLRKYHKDPTTFRCDVCGNSFKSERSLGSHKRQVHIDNRSHYHLHLCYCKTSKKLDAKNEVSSSNDYKYDTAVCCTRKQKILNDDALIAKWIAELKCRICGQIFPYYSLMHAHFYYRHPGDKCYIICCERNIFRMSDALEHIQIHLDPYAFKCELCNVPLCSIQRY